MKLLRVYVPHNKVSELVDFLKKKDYVKVVEEDPELTIVEKRILKYHCLGEGNAGIAKKIGLSARTVETYKNNLYLKTATNNPIELFKYGLKNGYVKLRRDKGAKTIRLIPRLQIILLFILKENNVMDISKELNFSLRYVESDKHLLFTLTNSKNSVSLVRYTLSNGIIQDLVKFDSSQSKKGNKAGHEPWFRSILKFDAKEVFIIQLLCDGKNLPDISKRLGISLKSAKIRLETIFNKSETRSLKALIKYAHKIGIVSLQSDFI